MGCRLLLFRLPLISQYFKVHPSSCKADARSCPELCFWLAFNRSWHDIGCIARIGTGCWWGRASTGPTRPQHLLPVLELSLSGAGGPDSLFVGKSSSDGSLCAALGIVTREGRGEAEAAELRQPEQTCCLRIGRWADGPQKIPDAQLACNMRESLRLCHCLVLHDIRH